MSIEGRLLNLELSLLGKWVFENLPNAYYIFLDNNEVELFVNDMPFELSYGLSERDGKLYITIINATNPDPNKVQSNEYEVLDISKSLGILRLLTSKGEELRFHP